MPHELPVQAALNELHALPWGWDGHRAAPVTDEAITGIDAVLSVVLTAGSIPPQLVPLPDGGVQADWLAAGDSLELEVDTAGDAYVFASNADGSVVLEGAADVRLLAAATWRLERLSARARTIS